MFERALMSVYKHSPNYKIEIIVNNDTSDIEEHYGDIDTRYYYERFDDLSSIYKFMYEQARGEYIMFLEDDDYMLSEFKGLGLDCGASLYFNEYLPDTDILATNNNIVYRDIITINRDIKNIKETSAFISKFNSQYFQLTQLIFSNKNNITFPSGNNLHNDYKLFQSLASTHNTIKYITGPIWRQTTDGKDNISFKNLNNDKRFR